MQVVWGWGTVVRPRAQAQDRWPENTAQEGLFKRRGTQMAKKGLLHFADSAVASPQGGIQSLGIMDVCSFGTFRRWNPSTLETVQGMEPPREPPCSSAVDIKIGCVLRHENSWWACARHS